MFNEIIKEMMWGNKKLSFKTGKIGRQADASVIASLGDTVVMANVVAAKEEKEGIDFFPLTVHYREMAYAAGKIPGGFFKREGKPTEKEVLISRLIDRPIRPLFKAGFYNETQIICTVLSHDNEANVDILAILASSAALAISGLPFEQILGAARVGFLEGDYILNPTEQEIAEGSLNLVLAGTSDSIMMVESEANELNEEQMLGALEFGHNAFVPVIELIKQFEADAGKEKLQINVADNSEDFTNINAKYRAAIEAAYAISSKQERRLKLLEIKEQVKLDFVDPEVPNSDKVVKTALKAVESEVVRNLLLKKKMRIDGRNPEQIRDILAEVSLLPRTHGSALFTRGETQAIAVATLGTAHDEQIIDGLGDESRDRFMLHYNFPPYSVGEATPLRPPGRREIGHGMLAKRALNAMLPGKDEFPYTIRVVSEITESNGSSSMATVCGASLAMMDAGVPLKAPVAGIAMGLVKDDDNFVVISDILGDEDHIGDMDFKVAGTKSGITALQMDIKIQGISLDIMKQALTQANQGRLHILGKMDQALSGHRTELSKHAPVVRSMQINKDKIRELIGPGGKVIKEICEVCDVKIDIEDDGKVNVASSNVESFDKAYTMIMSIVAEPVVGEIYDGSVVKIIDAGAFVNYFGNQDGFVHISEIADARIKDINEHLKMGQGVKVKMIGFDNRGKARLSIRQVSGDVIIDEPQNDNNNQKQAKSSSKPKKYDQKAEKIEDTVVTKKTFYN